MHLKLLQDLDGLLDYVNVLEVQLYSLAEPPLSHSLREHRDYGGVVNSMYENTKFLYRQPLKLRRGNPLD